MVQKRKYSFVLQKRNFDCGVAASSTLLLNAGIRVGYKKLEKSLKLSREGVSYSQIERYFKKYKKLKTKIKMYSKIKDLAKELKAGRLCMVVYQGWGEPHEQKALECGHYSVAVGIYRNKIYLLDPGADRNWGDGKGWRIMKLSDFKDKWVDKDDGKIVRRWMLSVASN